MGSILSPRPPQRPRLGSRSDIITRWGPWPFELYKHVRQLEIAPVSPASQPRSTGEPSVTEAIVRSVFVVSTPWAGAMQLCQLLSRNSSVPLAKPWFDPLAAPRLSLQLSVPLGAPDWAELYLSGVAAAATENGTCAVLLMWPHLRWLLQMARVAERSRGRADAAADTASAPGEAAAAPSDGALVASWFPNVRYVSISCANRGRQALRWYGKLLRGPLDVAAGRDGATPDLQHARWLEAVIERQERAWETFFMVHGIVPERVRYEDLARRPGETTSALLSSLGLEATPGRDSSRADEPDHSGAGAWAEAYRTARPRLKATIGVRRAGDTAAPPLDRGRADRPLRVLMSVRPYRGHFHPMVPLARAFERRGHPVVVATSEDLAEVVAPTRLRWFPAGMNPRQVEEISNRVDVDYGYLPVRAKVDDMLEMALSDFRPDVVIRDPTDLAAMIVAEVIGAVNVIYGLAQFIPARSWRILGADRTVRRLRRDFRLPEDPDLARMYTDLYLAVIPPDLETENPLPVPAVERVRYVPWDGESDAPADESGPTRSSRPLVLVTLGTVYNYETDVFVRFLQAMSAEDVDVVCTLGDGVDASVREAAGPNVRFETYFPHSKILPTCSAVLCHGGFNTVMGALAAGVPLVCVPLGSDQDFNATLCQRKGFGLRVDQDDATIDRLRQAVRTILDDGAFAARVKAFQRRLTEAPPLAETVRRIEELVAARALTSSVTSLERSG
jgi:UDP:flavonoid glycosyltransferase YjiC (YdhE family)/LPS sulfotransferase NodH